MSMLKKIIQNYGCDHDYVFDHNLYGDEINNHNGKRSVWRCSKCDKLEYCDDLYIYHDKSFVDHLDKLYNAYYENSYNEWCKEHADNLQFCMNQMTEKARIGQSWLHINIVCDTDTNDKEYYTKFFSDLGVKVEVDMDQEEYTKLTAFIFRLEWNKTNILWNI